LAENRRLNVPHLYLAPPLGVIPSDCRRYLRRQKDRDNGLSYRMALFADPAFSHFGTVSTYDRETDGQTDGRTHDDNIYRASIESRGKKKLAA